MRSLFNTSRGANQNAEADRESRHSSGWSFLQKFLASHDSLRILDVGPTSAGNINYITNLGHSIYMANLVDEAAKPDWMVPDETGEGLRFNVDSFVATNLDFSERKFDIVTFWDTADYLPVDLLQPVVTRLHEVMQPGGLLLAFFHAKAIGTDTRFSRYHLTSTDAIDIQRIGSHPLVSTYNNRQIEKLLSDFSGYKFFLAKDNLSEVIATR